MRPTNFIMFSLVMLIAVGSGSAQSLVTIYSHDFESQPGSEWSKRFRSWTPDYTTHFLGEFGGEEVLLDLANLPEHCSVTVSFELLIIGSWEGSVGWDAGPDVWDLNAFSRSDCCPVRNLLHTTFANCECRYQAYPDGFPNVHNPGLTGADEVDTLGYANDSVYYLSFKFFHCTDDLTLDFSASPDLELVDNESWGIDNIVVQIDSFGTYCCRAQRDLPIHYGANNPFAVTIDVTPNPRAHSYVIEENPPTGWQVSNINNGGTWESATNTVKWGPFLDSEDRVLTYTVSPPSWVTGSFAFGGTISVDGESEPICGDTVLNPGSYHPADLDSNWLLTADEFTAYGAAWRRGDPWTREPSSIPADYVTNAGLLWKLGELYYYEPMAAPPWSSSAKTAAPKRTAGSAASSLTRIADSPSGALEVTLTVRPPSATRVWAIEDALPPGWTAAAISDGGIFDAATGKVRWGLFLTDQPQALTYTATPALDQETSPGQFDGLASFDGVSIPVIGNSTYPRTESAPSSPPAAW